MSQMTDLCYLETTQLRHTFPGRSIVGTEEHGEFTADAVIVTVSLGVLKAEVIEFNPPLPVEKRLINDVGAYV